MTADQILIELVQLRPVFAHAKIEVEGETVAITHNCLFTEKPYTCRVPLDAMKIWLSGRHIQDAMPRVSTSDREFLITGVCPDAQNY